MDIASIFVISVILSVDVLILIVVFFMVLHMVSILAGVQKFADSLHSLRRRIDKGGGHNA